MKEPYNEGVANHIDPESCGHVGNGMPEALTGAHAGRVLSRESLYIIDRSADAVEKAEGNTDHAVIARHGQTPRGRRPRARMETPCTGTGRSHVRP